MTTTTTRQPTSPISTTTSPPAFQQQKSTSSQLIKSKTQQQHDYDQLVEQYEIRKNIFDFLARIRSDEYKRVFLLPKGVTDRKKIKISRSLSLEMYF